MRSAQLTDAPTASWMLVYDSGDTVKDALAQFAREHDIRAAHIHAIGAFRDAVLRYFDWDRREYIDIPIDEQVEVLTLTGTIAWHEDEPAIHAHVICGRRDGSTVGGHLKEAHVRPTLEMVVVASRTVLERRHDEESGLALLAV